MIHVQQNAQRELVKCACKAWSRKEPIKRSKGEKPTYKVVLAAEGHFHKKDLAAWTRQMRSEEPWRVLPRVFQAHELAILSFRALSACTCLKFEQQALVYDGFPFIGYLLLSNKAGVPEETTDTSVDVFENRPCTMCPFWFAHVRRFATKQLLLSAESIAEIQVVADKVEFDCIGVETNNANIHR